MTTQAHFQVGSLRVDVVSDGVFLQDAGAVMGIVPRPLWEPLAGPPDDRNRLPMALNCLLVRDGQHTVLIDTGVGDKIPAARREKAYPGDYGHLLRNLAVLGVRPAQIDIVINTHLHFDHCGWNTAAVHGGALIPTFPRARYLIQRGEWQAACNPNERTRATYLAENLAPLDASGQLDLAEGETAPLSWLTLLPTPGHTLEHVAIVLRSGGETAIYMGDMAQHACQIERPAWVSAFDLLPLVSMETKKALIARAVETNALLLTTHAPFPGAGRMQPVDGAIRFVPETLGGAPA